MERGCVQNTSRSGLKVYAALDQFANACLAGGCGWSSTQPRSEQDNTYALNEIQTQND